MSQRTAIVIVNYASHTLIDRSVSGDLEHAGFGVVVVDNHSSDAETVTVRELCAHRGWHLVTQDNLGFGGGVNAGVEAARRLGYERFIMLNPDAVASVEALDELARHVEAHPLEVVAPTILTSDGDVWFSGGTVLVDRGVTATRGADSSAPRGWITGACFALSDELWGRVGGFDDDYFLYWEDIDLSWRCVEAGGTLRVRDDICIVHDAGGTQDGAGKSPLYVYYNCRNRLLFAARHLDAATARRWRRQSLTYARRLVLRSGRRAFARNAIALTAAAVRGTRDGIRRSRTMLRTPTPATDAKAAAT